MSLKSEIQNLKKYVEEKTSRANKHSREKINVIHDIIINESRELKILNEKTQKHIMMLENKITMLTNENNEIKAQNDELRKIFAKNQENNMTQHLVLNSVQINNSCLLEHNMNKFNIIIDKNKKEIISKNVITTRDQVVRIFDNVYDLLFKNSNLLNYNVDELKSIINVKKRNDDILGQCIFKKCLCGKNQSIFDCNGPDVINIFLDNESTGIRVAMIIAHELMHIYFHKMKHLHKNITNINGEEGLCELVAFYVGLFIKSDLKCPNHNYETYNMFYEPSEKTIKNLTVSEHHIYTNYKLYFLRAYDDYKKYDGTLITYLNNVFLLKGISKI